MSQENVENLEQSWRPGTWKRGTGATSMCLCSIPRSTYEDTILPDHAGRRIAGTRASIRATERWIEPYEDLTIELERFAAKATPRLLPGPDRGRDTAASRSKGRSPTVWTFRERKGHSPPVYLDPAEALEAAGLSE